MFTWGFDLLNDEASLIWLDVVVNVFSRRKFLVVSSGFERASVAVNDLANTIVRMCVCLFMFVGRGGYDNQ